MSIRQAINERPGPVAAVTVALLLVAVWIVVKANSTATPEQPNQAFYTVDDGTSLFSDQIDKPTPFMHDGKEAVRARVYTCDGGRTQFVGYLEKHTDDFRKKLESSIQKGEGIGPLRPGLAFGTLVKKPGEKEWMPLASSGGGRMTGTVACSGGKLTDLAEHYPDL